MQNMEPVAIVTMLVLVQCFVFSMLVGKARVQGGIEAPATTGTDEFDRRFRVHQNTLEQLIIFLPAMWLFGWYVNVLVAAGCGLVFIAGRQLYSADYVRDPKARSRGFIVGQLAQIILVLGSIIGPVLSWLR